jgi:16S rRNA (uracil1498-N3)-methyltransferase
MHRFHLPPNDCRGETLKLAGAEAHHALRVLRIQDGERVTVLDGAGATLDCEVTGRTRDTLALRVRERSSAAPLPCAITLLVGVPKGKIIESIIQKATELGVARIVPLLSERVITQLDAEGADAKAEKWQHVAIEALKQCGSPWLPRVEPPVTPAQFLARQEKCDLALVGCLEPGSRHPRVWFEQFLAEHKKLPACVAVWVGPEGDFTAAEYAGIQKSGAHPITLGPLVLRVETAATYCLSVVNYELQAERGQ